MKHINSFESFLNESYGSFKVGDRVKHFALRDIVGEITSGPNSWDSLHKEGFDKDASPEEIEDPSQRDDAEDKSKKVWFGVQLDNGGELIIHQEDLKK
jgi:hypothetical protein